MTTGREDGERPPVEARLVASLASSKKYRYVSPRTLERVAREALRDERMRLGPATKLARRRLHQLYGAYAGTQPAYARLFRALEEHPPDDAARRRALERILSHHASTRERLPYLAGFYDAVWRAVPKPRRILDLACGLNPLCFPWMDLPPEVEYHALDIDRAALDLVGRFFDLLGITHQEHEWDLIEGPPRIEADLALLLKAVPCLERQRRGAAAALIDALPVERVLVSFPTHSLGGRSKAMERNYSRDIEDEASRRNWTLERLPIEAELVFVVRR